MSYDDKIAERYRHIKYSKHWSLSDSSVYLMGKCDAMVEAICSFPIQPEFRRELLRVTLVKGAQATTAIEGNTLTEAEIRQVFDGKSLAASKEYQEREVKNILDAMNKIFEQVANDGQTPLVSAELIKSFHQRVGAELGEHFDAIPGQFRTDPRVVGPYQCPRPEHVEELIRRLCVWLREEFGFSSASRQSFADALIQAIVTHVYLEWIHPFGDGNGRTGRLLEFYILVRAGNPDIVSHILSNFYNETRPEYYRQLDLAGKTGELTSFLSYAIQGYHDGLSGVVDAIAGSQLKTSWQYLVHTRFAERPYHKKTVFKRRRRLALAVPPGKWMKPEEIAELSSVVRSYASLSAQTLQRDLRELRQMEIIVERGGKYRANLALLVPQRPKRRKDVTAA